MIKPDPAIILSLHAGIIIVAYPAWRILHSTKKQNEKNKHNESKRQPTLNQANIVLQGSP